MWSGIMSGIICILLFAIKKIVYGRIMKITYILQPSRQLHIYSLPLLYRNPRTIWSHETLISLESFTI